MLRSAVADADVVITTALIPNRPAPVLVKAEAVAAMRRGSVMVDLAAENGGNIEGTVKDQATVTANGVTILGYTDLVSRLSTTASNLFGNNVAKFLLSVGPQTRGTKGAYAIDYEDEAVRGMLVVDKGVLTYPAPPYEAPPPPPPKAAAPVEAPPPAWRKYAKVGGLCAPLLAPPPRRALVRPEAERHAHHLLARRAGWLPGEGQAWG